MKRTMMMVTLIAVACTPVMGRAAPPLKPEDALKERVSSFTKALLKENYDEAVKFVDPEIVDEHGSDKVKDTGKHLMNLIRGVAEAHWRKLTGYRIRKVEFAKDNKSAVVDLYYYTGWKHGGGDRQEFPGDQHWVLRNNTWYWTNK